MNESNNGSRATPVGFGAVSAEELDQIEGGSKGSTVKKVLLTVGGILAGYFLRRALNRPEPPPPPR
jgi:hypothetical protein